MILVRGNGGSLEIFCPNILDSAFVLLPLFVTSVMVLDMQNDTDHFFPGIIDNTTSIASK